MKQAALFIIDMQNDFVLDGVPLRGDRPVLLSRRSIEVLTGFRKKRSPVFHILRVHRRDESDVEITRQELFRKHPFAVEGTHGAAVIEELTPLPGEYIIPKIRMSAFIGTELDLMLRNIGVEELVVTGIQTPNCVRTTVFDAVAYNYPVILIKDAVGAQSDDIHEANIRDIANMGVKILKTADLGTYLG